MKTALRRILNKLLDSLDKVTIGSNEPALTAGAKYILQQIQISRELNRLTLKLDNMKALADHAEEYFSLLDKPEQTPAEKLRLKMSKPVLESNNIVNRSDFEYLKFVVADTGQKAAPLKENFEKCRRLYDIYSEITKTYYEISREDYISRLVEEKRKTAEAKREKADKKNKR